MNNFEDFFSEYEDKHNCSPEKYECFEAGQQSKQAEIDELRKRIDEALYYLDFNHDNDKDIAINILKGDQS